MVRRPERTRKNEVVQLTGDGKNLSHLQRFRKSHVRHNRRYGFSQHRFARTRRTYHQNIVTACNGYFHCPTSKKLSLYVLHVVRAVLQIVWRPIAGNEFFYGFFACQMFYDRALAFGRINVHSRHELRLRNVFLGNNNVIVTLLSGRYQSR